MSKNAQSAAQIFIYIITIIIVSIIFLFGYKAITDNINRMQTISLLDFQNKLKADIDRVSKGYGSEETITYSLAGYKEICFMENYQGFLCDALASCKGMPDPRSSQWGNHTFILQEARSMTGNNLFLIKSNSAQPTTGNLGLIEIQQAGISDPLLLCLSFRNSEVTIKIDGAGDHAIISAP